MNNYTSTIEPRAWVVHKWGMHRTVSDWPKFRVDECCGLQGCSSLHRHSQATNEFYLGFGCIDIVTEDTVYRLDTEGESVVIPQGVNHRLVVVEPSMFFEIYRVDEGGQWDIIREDEGSNIYQP